MEVGNNPFPSEEVTGLAAFENLEPVSSLSVVPETEESDEPSPSASTSAAGSEPPESAETAKTSQRQERLDRTLPLDLSAPPRFHRSDLGGADEEEEELDPAPEDEVIPDSTLLADGLPQRDAPRLDAHAREQEDQEDTDEDREPTADHLFDASGALTPGSAPVAQAADPSAQAGGWDDDEATRVITPLSAAEGAAAMQMEWDDEEPPTTMQPYAMFESSPIAAKAGWDDPEENRTEIYEDALTPGDEPLPPAPQRNVVSATQTLTGGQPSPFPQAAPVSGDNPYGLPGPSVAALDAPKSHEARIPGRFIEALKAGDRRSWLVLGGGAVGLLLLALIIRAAGGSHAVGSAVFSTQPADARVSVDDKVVPGSGSPYSLADLAPGTHRVVVSKAGFKDYNGEVVIERGESKTVPLIELAPLAREVGFAIRSTPEGAAVWIDGQSANEVTPARLTGIAPGIHRLQLKLDGYTEYELQMFVPDGTLLQLPAAELVPSADAAHAAKPARPSARSKKSDDEEELAAAPRARSRKSDDDDEPAPRSSYRSRKSDDSDDFGSSRASRSSTTTEKSAPASSGKLGTLRLNTRPWSQVIVDGRMVGNTPQPNLQLSAGKHKLQLINQQLGLNKTVTVTIEPGEINTQVLNLAE